MKASATLSWAFLFAVLAACGGGGDGTSVPEPVTTTASLSASKARVNEAVTLTWSSSHATACAIPELSASSQPASGSLTVTPSAGGRFTYTVTCTGAGAPASQVLSLVVPMPVLSTSYENTHDIALDDPTIPTIFGILNITIEPGEQGFSPRAIAFADFAQDGSYDVAVTVSTIYKGVYTDGSNPAQWSDSPGKLYFLKRGVNGQWADVTATFLTDPSTRYVCVSPGFINVTDFNNDSRPDFNISCTGPDFPIVSQGNSFRDLSAQYVALSQPDGTYRITQLPIAPIYSHQSAAADLDGDGNVDILSVDTSAAPGGHRKPLVLWGHGDGTFTADYTIFPPDTQDKSIFGLVAEPVNGQLQVILSGNPPGSYVGSDPADYGTKVLQYTNGALQYVADFTPGIPQVTRTGLTYGLMFDAVYRNGAYYTIRVAGDYSGEAYIRMDAVTGASTILLERLTGGVNGAGSAGILKITSAGMLVNEMANCTPGALPSDYFHDACTLSLPAP